MTNKEFYTVHGWMMNELGLKGIDLLVYAIIYGFTQIPEQMYFGTRRQLSAATGASIPTVQRSLDSLVERGLLLKEVSEVPQNGMRLVSYRANLSTLYQNDTGIKMIHNNNIQYSTDSKGLRGSEGSKSISHKFNKPTVEEVEAYCKEKGYFIDAAYFVDYYESKGWLIGKTPMKDWKAAVRTWVKNNRRTATPARRQPEVKFLD